MAKTKRKDSNDFWEENEKARKVNSFDKRKEKRIDRALKTKNIDIFIEEDDLDESYW